MAPAVASLVGETEVKRQLRSVFSHVRWEHCAAGVSGGVISTLALHPLDLIKIRFQVNEGVAVTTKRPQYHGVIDALMKIGRQDGIRGLYQGVTPNVCGAGASWGLYFLFYNSIKTWKQSREQQKVLSAAQHMTAAAEAGILTLTLTNPVWVAKTRLCLQYENQVTQVASSGNHIHYRGFVDCLVKIYTKEGIRGLYKGFIPGIVGVSHGALQFMAYEELKKFYNGYRKVPLDTKFNSEEYLCFAALSKIFAASITYPYQVVRSRLQDQHREYKGIRDVLGQTWRLEGVNGFYKGLVPSLLRVTPACCITFVIYENMVRLLTSEEKGPKSNKSPSSS